jgi:hypothetical protein
MEAARTSETLVNFYQTTRRYNSEDSHLRIHRCENLKSYILIPLSPNKTPKIVLSSVFSFRLFVKPQVLDTYHMPPSAKLVVSTAVFVRQHSLKLCAQLRILYHDSLPGSQLCSGLIHLALLRHSCFIISIVRASACQ